jgi:hypothetical protein
LMRRAVRRSTSASGNSVRICVASYTTVALDAELDGRQPAFGMADSFHPLLNLHPVPRRLVTKR